MTAHEKRAAIRALAFADGFAVHRRKRGWSLRMAAKETGVPHVSLHDIELGRRLPHVETLYRLCHTYRLPFAEMVAECGAVRACNEARRAGLL